jgi:hypothetical protein
MKSSFVAAALIAGAVLSLHAAPASANSDVHWSVTIGSPGYYQGPVVVHQPPVVVHRHPHVIHRPPAHVPPTVVYVPVYPRHQPFLNTYAHPDRQQYRYERPGRMGHSDRHWQDRHHGHRHGKGHDHRGGHR